MNLPKTTLEQWAVLAAVVDEGGFAQAASVLNRSQSAISYSVGPSTQIQVADVVLSGAEQAIIVGSADLVVTSRVPPGYLSDWLLDVNFIAVARADHPLLKMGRELTTDDLAHHVQVVVRDSGTSHPRDEGWLGAPRRFTVSSMDASLATILAGLAYAWLPEHLLAEALRSGTLRRLPLVTGASRNVSLHIVLVHPNVSGPAARAAAEAFHRGAKVPAEEPV